MGEVLEYEAEGDAAGLPEQRVADIQQIQNHRAAVRRAETLHQLAHAGGGAGGPYWASGAAEHR